jgi:hypothetical protein
LLHLLVACNEFRTHYLSLPVLSVLLFSRRALHSSCDDDVVTQILSLVCYYVLVNYLSFEAYFMIRLGLLESFQQLDTFCA